MFSLLVNDESYSGKKGDWLCNCNLSALIEELARRPLTCRSLAHCAPGHGEPPAPFGEKSRAQKMD